MEILSSSTSSTSSKVNLGKYFKPLELIGQGTFGTIYKAQNIKSGQYYALKVEQYQCQHPQLFHECDVYELINKNPKKLKPPEGFPNIHYCATEGDENLLAMDLLGPSIQDLFIYYDKHFLQNQVNLIGQQMLSRIEYLHNNDYIHRDIKPDNFLVGRDKNSNKIYMIDLGLSKKYVQDKIHISYIENKIFIGTRRFASINTHLGIEQSRRDDLEGLAYVLIYLFKGSLPWINEIRQKTSSFHDRVKEIKMKTTISDLCATLPICYAKFLSYTKNLRFDQKPDYEYLRSLILCEGELNWENKNINTDIQSFSQSKINVQLFLNEELNNTI